MRQEKMALQRRIDIEMRGIILERLFWFNLVSDFKYHHAKMTVATEMCAAELEALREAVATATMDILLSPSDPNSPIARHSRHDPNARRQGFGIARDIDWVQEMPKEALPSFGEMIVNKASSK
jgi:hypothetical protein